MNEIIPNFYGLPGMLVGRVYVIKDADGLTLIDTAVPPAGKRIIKAIQAAGYQASDIKRVMLTHAHPDHFGGLRAVVEATGAEVWASAAEADVLEGRIAVPRANRGELRGINRLLVPPDTRFKPPVKVSRILNDGEVLPVLDGLTVVATPGHAPGHVSFWHPAKKLLITGDVVFHLFGRLTLPLAFFTVDMALDKQQIRKLANLGAEVGCFGHGNPIRTDASAEPKAFADRVGA